MASGGMKEPMPEEYKAILKKVSDQLMLDLQPGRVLQKMSVYFVFDTNEEEEIEAGKSSGDRTKALLRILEKKPLEAYNYFKKALQQAQPHLASVIVKAVVRPGVPHNFSYHLLREASDNLVGKLDAQSARIAERLKLGDRVEKLAKKEAFITLKDYKPTFHDQPTCRLINPSKSEIGVISKQILDETKYLHHQQYENKPVEEHIWRFRSWFKSLENKEQLSFICFDVCEFYPSITENPMSKELDFASTYRQITNREREIILHAKQSVLFSDDCPWEKKSANNQFDVTMGSFDGAETFELVGCHLLSILTKKYGRNIGLYRDDGLAAPNGNPKEIEKIKKELAKSSSIYLSVVENEVADFKEKEKEVRKQASRTEQSYETSQTTTQPASGVKDTQFSCSSSNQPETLSQDHDPVHVYKMYKDKRPPSMLEPDSSFYLSVNYFKTETHASVKGRNWFKAQPMGVNKLNDIMKDMTQAARISGKTSHSGRKTLLQKLQDSGVPPNQIIQITRGHKNVQSVNNYSSLRIGEKQMESISRILSSTTKAATNVAQTENNLTAQHLAEHRIASASTTSSTLDLNSFKENRLQTMFHENYITGGVFNINLAPAKNEVKGPEADPTRKKRRLIIESDSSQESST
ncbi:hypothetical protein AWC38_SpisGene11228 [Stylophora pistillata]|uniref:CARD domain-containing protein n=1 Tax=Stylophora pistillata TaxID=50429 RepID=A0A2B4S565_STYPI|nr:hypothetical protein AWC38_SpisGene11228 [Stylophora pistillata]